MSKDKFFKIQGALFEMKHLTKPKSWPQRIQDADNGQSKRGQAKNPTAEKPITLQLGHRKDLGICPSSELGRSF